MVRIAEALLTLTRRAVDFVVVGGVAAAIRGSIAVTYDLDICYSRDESNLKRLSDALAPHHPKLRDLPTDLPFVWDAATLRNGFLFTLTTDLGDIDLLPEIDGVGSFEQVASHSSEIELEGQRIRVLSLSALIRAKRAAGRPKDLLALPELEALKEAESEDE